MRHGAASVVFSYRRNCAETSDSTAQTGSPNATVPRMCVDDAKVGLTPKQQLTYSSGVLPHRNTHAYIGSARGDITAAPKRKMSAARETPWPHSLSSGRHGFTRCCHTPSSSHMLATSRKCTYPERLLQPSPPPRRSLRQTRGIRPDLRLLTLHGAHK